MSDLCRGGSGDCECEEYQLPENLALGEKPLCEECGHGKSKHPKPTGVAAPSTGGNAEVLRIFKQASLGANENKNPVMVTRRAAKAEVMKGYRPEATEGSNTRKEKNVRTMPIVVTIEFTAICIQESKNKSKSKKARNTMVSVSSIVVMTCGLNVCEIVYRRSVF